MTKFYLNIQICTGQLFMKIKTTLLVVLILLAIGIVEAKSKQDNKKKQIQTSVAFIISQQIQEEKEENQVIELTVQISAQDSSLADAIEMAQQHKKQLRQTFQLFCNSHKNISSFQDCQKNVQTSQYQMDALYYHLRGQQLFKTFQVQFQIKFIISAFRHIGTLIDQFKNIMKYENIVIKRILWKDKNFQGMEEYLISEGLRKAKNSCKNLGLELYRIKSITIVEEEEEEEQKKAPAPKKEQQQQDEQQQQQQVEVKKITNSVPRYKFLGTCRYPKQKQTQKKAQQKKIIKQNTKNTSQKSKTKLSGK